MSGHGVPTPESLLLDTNCFIYLLENPDSLRGNYVRTQVLAPAVAGRKQLYAATLTVTELLCQPFADGQPGRAAALLGALEGLPGLTLLPLTVAIAAEAAQRRGQSAMTVADAIVVATASDVGAALLTNDRRLSAAPGVDVLILDDLVATA